MVILYLRRPPPPREPPPREPHAGRTARTAGSRSAATHAGRCTTKGAPVCRAPRVRDLPIANAVASTSPVRIHIACTATTVGHVSGARIGAAVGRVSSASHATPIATRRLLSGLVLACVCLPISHGVASSSAAIFVGGRSVGIWRAPTVLRIVLPAVALAAGCVDARLPPFTSVAAVNVCVALLKVIVVVNRDVVVAPPSASVAPAAAPCGPHRDPDTERYRHARRVVAKRRI